MQNIRKSVFETNSSSSHSIHIDTSTELNDFIIPNDDGNVVLNGGEFGWEYIRFNDALTKANYCAVYLSEVGKYIEHDNNYILSRTKEQLEEDERYGTIRKFKSNYEQEINSKKELLKEVLLHQTLANSIIFDLTTDWNSDKYSNIDHQSIEKYILDPVFENYETLRNFIFNKKCWLFLGNDNSQAPSNFYDVDCEFKYVLILDNMKKTAFLKENYTKKDLTTQFESLWEENVKAFEAKLKDEFQSKIKSTNIAKNQDDQDINNEHNNKIYWRFEYDLKEKDDDGMCRIHVIDLNEKSVMLEGNHWDDDDAKKTFKKKLYWKTIPIEHALHVKK